MFDAVKLFLHGLSQISFCNNLAHDVDSPQKSDVATMFSALFHYHTVDLLRALVTLRITFYSFIRFLLCFLLD